MLDLIHSWLFQVDEPDNRDNAAELEVLQARLAELQKKKLERQAWNRNVRPRTSIQGHCGCYDHDLDCSCDCENPNAPIWGSCKCGGDEASEEGHGYSEESRSRLMPADWAREPLSTRERRLAVAELARLDRDQVPNPLEFGHAGPAEILYGNKNWVRSLLTKGWKGTQNESTEVLRALMSAFDSAEQRDADNTKFWIVLAGRLLVDSIAKINQRIKDGLLEAVNTPELSSKRKKRATFLREADLAKIDRAREVNSAILATNYRANPRRSDEGKGGKGKGHSNYGKGGGKGKGRW